MSSWTNYPLAVLKAAPEQMGAALATHYETVSPEQLDVAYTCVAKGLAVVEEFPRGTLGGALRRHLGIIAAEQEKRGLAT